MARLSSGLASLSLALTIAGLLSSAPAHGRELITGFDDAVYTNPHPEVRELWLERSAEARARIVRIDVQWSLVVAQRPNDPRNPADPAYNFSRIDGAVSSAAAQGLDVLLTVAVAPAWAEGPARDPAAPPGSWRPDPAALGAFAHALATRYSGEYTPPPGLFRPPAPNPLPRVSRFQAWNEPNLDTYISPQHEGSAPASPEIYRGLLNAFYAEIKSVDPSNTVLTAGTAPFGERAGGDRVRPLRFWRDLLCLEGRRALLPTACPTPAVFDVAAHHPINTVGGPRDSAEHPDDVTVPDVRLLRRTIRSAERQGQLPGERHPLWVTELWWETNPPDGAGVSLARQARWIAEAFYVLWKQRVPVVLTIGVQDAPYDGNPGSETLQSGIYFADGEPKPSARAFRFPFVLSRAGRAEALAWAIAPESGRLRFQRFGDGAWQTVASRRVSRYQVVRTKVRAKRASVWRAELRGEQSLHWTFRR